MGLQESVGAQLRDTPRCQLLAVRPTSVVLREAAAAAAFRHDSPCRPASRPVPPPRDDRPTDRRPYLISSAVVMNGRPRDGNTIGRRRRRAGDPGRPAQTPAAVPARLVRRSAPAQPRLASPRPAVNLTTSSARRYVCRTTPARRKDSRRTPSLPCGTYDRCPPDTCPRTSP